MTVVVGIETVVLAVLVVLVAGLLRGYATVLRRLHDLDGARDGAPAGPPAAAPGQFRLPIVDEHVPIAHDITGESLRGELATVRVADVEHDTLLLFLSSGCSSCAVFWAELAQPLALPPDTRLLVVPQGTEHEDPRELGRLAPDGIDVIASTDAWRDYEVPGSPHAVFVEGRSGRVRGEGTGQSLRQVAQMLARATGEPGFVAAPGVAKPSRDAQQEAAVDRELLRAGIAPGDPRLYQEGRAE